MKAYLALLISIFLLSSAEVLAQESNWRLFPQSGKKYIYEFNESTFIQAKGGEKLNKYIKSKVLEVEYQTSEPGNQPLLFVTLTKNIAKKPDEKPYMLRDYAYPVFVDGYYGASSKDYYEYLLCGATFKYQIDEKTSEIKLFNRDELLMVANKKLKEKGFDETKKDRRIEDFNKKGIPAVNKIVQSLFQVSSEMLDPQEYDMKLEFRKPVSIITNKRWDTIPGIYERNYSINQEERYLMEYQQVEIDSGRYSFVVQGETYSLIHKEQKIKLININQREGTRLTISGTVENQLNKKVTLAFMRKPYGTKLYQETVFLDENNSFYIETEMEHAGLAFLMFGQTSSSVALPCIPLYVEPGSAIHINASGEFPWKMDFSGDFATTQNLLYNFNKEYNWLKQKINFNSFTWWWTSQLNYSDLQNAIDNFDSFTRKYKNGISDYIFEFVSNELKANLMCGVMKYLRDLEFQSRGTWGTNFLKNADLIDKNYLEEQLNSVEIHEIYNPYGMFSRQFANMYLTHYFLTIKKVHNLDYPGYRTAPVISGGIRFYGDLPHKIEVAKTVLAGPAFYGQIAEMLVQEKTRVYNRDTKDVRYRQNEVEKYFDLMIRLCNDRQFSQSLKNILDTQSQWDNKEYVPYTKFFNEKAEPKYMKDFLGEKPTLFYVTSQWSRERYHFDDLAQKNPEINFVLIAEGSNITEWMDYTKRAEPIAKQLFLINHEKQLNTVFKSGTHHFIAYDKNGIRIGFHGNMVSGMNLCKQSLKNPKKKELNKSQLQTIIVVLLISLTALLLFILIWKWRVRQHFRKEEQTRKLRELELTAIRSQMNPHFLFNSLNSVQNLVQQNKGREAHLYLSDFAGLIRKVLNNSEKEEVSLAEELEMINQYLSLEKLRFDFNVHVRVDDKIDMHNTMVPSMLLQPFVENAVVHGLHNKKGEKQIKIELEKIEDGIGIGIEDNGIGRKAAKEIAKAKNGKSTKLMKERLEILQDQQGEKYNLIVIDLDEGTRVEIVIPEES